MKSISRQQFDLETRFAADDAPLGTFSGYASAFDVTDSYGTSIKRGSFTRTLADHRREQRFPPMLWSHDTSEIIGKWTSISEDQNGLKVVGHIVSETRRGAEALALMRAGALSGISIGFRTLKDERGPNGTRSITDLDLVEISLVALPANPRARIEQVRSTNPNDLARLIEACRNTSNLLKGNRK